MRAVGAGGHQGDVTAMQAHVFAGDGEAQAGAARARRTGERLEQCGARALRDAGTRVHYVDFYIAAA